MEECRRLGLCFNCNEKFVRGHNHVCQRIFFLDLADDDDDAAETGADAPQVSLHAIAGVRSN